MAQEDRGYAIQPVGNVTAKREDEKEQDQTEDRPRNRQSGKPRQDLAGQLEDQKGCDRVYHIRKLTQEADGEGTIDPGRHG